MEKPFRILSLDGGGYKGLATAACLAEFERQFGLKCSDVFSMFCGTSTGAIIALALANGISAQEIRDLYVRLGSNVFENKYPLQSFFRTVWMICFGAKYSNKNLKKELANIFGDSTIDDINKKKKFIVVPTLCLSVGRPWIFKTTHAEQLGRDKKYKLADVALASSSAPVYFPISKVYSPEDPEHYDLFVDGGMFANNPSVIGLVEAIKFLKIETQRIKMLSISPPAFNLHEPGHLLSKSALLWNSKLVDMCLQGTSIRDHYVTDFILDKGNYLRLQPTENNTLPKAMDKTDKDSTRCLISAGKDMAQINFSNQLIKEVFTANN